MAVTPYGYHAVNPQGLPLASVLGLVGQGAGLVSSVLGGGGVTQFNQPAGTPAPGTQPTAPTAGLPFPTGAPVRPVIEIIVHQGDPVTSTSTSSDSALTSRVSTLESKFSDLQKSLDSINQTLADAKKAGKL
jgi:hypothetical protein